MAQGDCPYWVILANFAVRMEESVKHIRIAEFNYELPDERIAKFPLAERDSSKLLLYRHGEVSEDVFRNLPQYLRLRADLSLRGL